MDAEFTKKPLISVIMSVYNNRAFIGPAIRSVLNQTCREFEFLITDDGSTDGSAAVIDEFAANDARIRVFHQANTGLTVALNRMISESRGEYIARMDSDDLSQPLRFAMQCRYLSENAFVGVVGTGWLNINEQGRPIAGYIPPDDHDFLVRRLERGRNDFRHGSIMLRKNALMVLEGPYRFRYGQDLDLLLRLSGITRVGMVQDVLFLYRVHGGAIQGAVAPYRASQATLMLELHQLRKQGREESNWMDNDLVLFPPGLDLSSGDDTQCLFIRGVTSFEAGSLSEARQCFRCTCRYRGYRVRSLVYWGLTLLPWDLGRWVKGTLDLIRDELRDYRVSPDKYNEIMKSFGLEH